MRPLSLLLAALTLGCGHAAPRARPAAAPSLADHPEVVACRVTPGACHGSAWRALRGEGDLAGDWAAAAFLIAGCEGGSAPSCADLGELYAAGRGVPVDHGRACDLGRTASCAKAGRSPPFVAATPTGPLPPPLPGAAPAPPAPADVDGYARWAWSLYPELHAPLGLTREALAAVPPAPAAERALVNLVVARRMEALRACVPAELVAPSSRAALTAIATFTVGADGRPAAPAVRSVEVPHWARSEAWDRCAEAVVAGWALPLTPSGGRLWLTFPGAGAPVTTDPGPAGGDGKSSPAYAVKGWRKPVLRDPACVADHLHVPYKFSGYVSGPITVRFAVEADGRAAWFGVITNGVPGPIAEAIWKSVRGCDWAPGADPAGTPASVWVILPLRFVSEG